MQPSSAQGRVRRLPLEGLLPVAPELSNDVLLLGPDVSVLVLHRTNVPRRAWAKPPKFLPDTLLPSGSFAFRELVLDVLQGLHLLLVFRPE